MITGCHKGAGLNILQKLASSKPHYKFLMAVRSVPRGESALDEIKNSVPDIYERVKIHHLDISNSHSIDTFVKMIKENSVRIDCLVNNATMKIPTSKVEDNIVRETFETNFYGTVELTEKLLPLLPDGAKIVNITTELAMLGNLHDPDLQKRFEDPSLTRDGLFQIAKDYHERVKAHEPALTEHPFPTSAFPVYCFSKLLLNVYTRVLSRDSQVKNKGIQVYCCSPGSMKDETCADMEDKMMQEGGSCPADVVNFSWKVQESMQGKFFSNSEVTPL